jgi:coiled-coil and C2 domain-containing protein 2A
MFGKHGECWANIQKDSSPNLIQFEMSNAKLWSPLFTTKFPRPNLGTVQPEKLIYEITDSREISSLRFQIESVLRERFMRWRKGQLTKWNYEFLRDLQGVLENLEKHAGRAYPEMDKVYNKINERYSMYGFPINLPYMEMDSIVERVQAAGIHANTAKNIEFALVVYVKGYSNSVLSIWIFLAALTYRRNR